MGYRSHYRETIRPPQRYLHLVDGNEDNGELPSYPETPAFNEADLSDKPEFMHSLPVLDKTDRKMVNRQFKERLASVIAVDDMIGTLIETLTATGQMDETMVIITSDNGYMFGEHRLNAKLYAFDEAIRVPLVIRPAGGASASNSNAIIINNDHAPTLAAYTGISPEREMDGKSYLNLVQNPTAPWPRKRFLIEHYEEKGASPKADPIVYITTGILGAWKDLSPPPYKAIREISATQNTLMVNWDENHQLIGEVSKEFYDLDLDPYQMESQGDVFRNELETFVRFKTCKGSTCWQLETK